MQIKKVKSASGFDVVVEVGKGEEGVVEVVDKRTVRIAVEKGAEGMRRLGGYGVKEAFRRRARSLCFKCDAPEVVEGALLALHSYSDFKKPKHRLKAVAFTCDSVEEHKKRAEAQNYARWLAEHPSNVATPQFIAEELKKRCKKLGIKIKVYSARDLERMKMGGILAVGKGSANPPLLVEMEYKGRGPEVCLVGKGITFDTGGISLKPSKNLHEMKYDKCGAIAVASALFGAASLKCDAHLRVLLPFAENVPGGRAQKPGDIIRIRNGKTVEVLNTDAEGRLILADALSFASEKNPDYIVDLATLTGAMVVALGRHAAGIFANNKKLQNALIKAGEREHERLWPMPLWKEYGEMMKSDFADLKNISETVEAGSATAAAFLSEFVEGKWAHIDIAGTAWLSSNSHPYLSKGATGFGVRLLMRWLDEIS